VIAGAASVQLFVSTAHADETCLSPCMAKIVGHEDFVHSVSMREFRIITPSA